MVRMLSPMPAGQLPRGGGAAQTSMKETPPVEIDTALALEPQAAPPGTYRQRGASSLQRLFHNQFPEFCARYTEPLFNPIVMRSWTFLCGASVMGRATQGRQGW
jgi:hypothetical protein